MKLLSKPGAILALCLLAFSPLISLAQTDAELISGGERILNFRSDINIEKDASMTVKETIKVVATGDKIKRGIYRDFPTVYKDELGNNYRVKFEVLKVLRDGSPDDFHITNEVDGKRVYIGNANIFLSPGVYTYELTYKTDRQIGFFEDHDELFWNVTGNGWEFNIESAEAHITLPESSPGVDIRTEAYTGAFGSTETNYSAQTDDGVASFYTTKPLGQYEGLTIVAGWRKGVVTEPTQAEKVSSYAKDNIWLLVAILILLVVLIYYIFAWRKFGVDPKARAIIAQYEPPRGLSPAAVSYINKMGFENKAMVAAIISMAVKGYLKVDELKVNYRLTKLGKNEATLSSEEKRIGAIMFNASDTLLISSENYQDVIDMNVGIKDSLKNSSGEKYFVKNWKYLITGVVISLVGLAAAISYQPPEFIPGIVFMTVWIMGWTAGLFAIGRGIKDNWTKKRSRSIIMTPVFLVYLAIYLGAFVILATIFSKTLIAYFIVILTLNIIFAVLLPRRTIEGRLVQDEIEGFKLFLTVTEKDRMNFHNPPEKTPELFEKFLPYALALGVENKWANQFDDVFEKLGPEGYHPSWYNGSALRAGTLSGFARGMSSSLGGSISHSSHAPGSSSGFSGGGGGGSGGGGGGGGGGGW